MTDFFKRNKAYVKKGLTDFVTRLKPAEEKEFRTWVKKNKVPFDLNQKTPQDYDMRGFWKGLMTGDEHATSGVNPNDKQLHFSDYWKTPYHQSFSAESKYADPSKAPDWQGDKLVGKDGSVIFDETKKAKPMTRNSGLGVLLGISNGIARIFRHDGTTMDVPASRLPAGTNEGDDVRVDSSKRGFSRISPVGVRAKASDSAPHDTAHDRQQFVMSRLIKHGWTPEQAAGATGRFMVEAYDRLDTNARNPGDPGTSEGLGQWNRERKSALYSFAKKLGKSPSDLGVQVDFFDHEIRTSPLEHRALIALSHAKSPDEAATAMLHYERPKGYTPGNPQGGALWGKTVKNANRVMQAYDPNFTPSVNVAGGGSGSDSTSSSPGGSGDDSLGDGSELLADEGLDTGLMSGPDAEASTEEQTLGEAIGSAADTYGQPGQTVDTSGTAQAIQNMIQEGQQANAGALPRLPEPSFRDVFGEG